MSSISQYTSSLPLTFFDDRTPLPAKKYEKHNYKHKHSYSLAAFVPYCDSAASTGSRERKSERDRPAKYFVRWVTLVKCWQHTAPAKPCCNTNPTTDVRLVHPSVPSWGKLHSLTGCTRWIVIQDWGRGNSTRHGRGRGERQRYNTNPRSAVAPPNLSLSLVIGKRSQQRRCQAGIITHVTRTINIRVSCATIIWMAFKHVHQRTIFISFAVRCGC